MTLPRRTPLRRGGPLRRSAPLARSARRRTTVTPAQRALSVEWADYSADVRARRPRCEAGPVMGAAGIAASGSCSQRATMVHHKWPHGSGGPYVPSEGLTESDVVAICPACHAYVHDSGDRRVRYPSLDLLRPHRREGS